MGVLRRGLSNNIVGSFRPPSPLASAWSNDGYGHGPPSPSTQANGRSGASAAIAVNTSECLQWVETGPSPRRIGVPALATERKGSTRADGRMAAGHFPFGPCSGPTCGSEVRPHVRFLGRGSAMRRSEQRPGTIEWTERGPLIRHRTGTGRVGNQVREAPLHRGFHPPHRVARGHTIVIRAVGRTAFFTSLRSGGIPRRARAYLLR